MGDTAEAIRSRLNSLLDELARVRSGYRKEAVPSASELEALALEMAAARDALATAEAGGGLDGIPDGERLELARTAVAARTQLSLLARLATGAARFASLVKGAGNGTGKGLYGKDGKAPGVEGKSSVEKKI